MWFKILSGLSLAFSSTVSFAMDCPERLMLPVELTLKEKVVGKTMTLDAGKFFISTGVALTKKTEKTCVYSAEATIKEMNGILTVPLASRGLTIVATEKDSYDYIYVAFDDFTIKAAFKGIDDGYIFAGAVLVKGPEGSGEKKVGYARLELKQD